jgi:hypothetical protein
VSRRSHSARGSLGSRRSGTTILFDLFWGDRRFTCWYEPLNRIRPAKGGGSGARGDDYMEPVTRLRERFLASRGDPSLDQDALNWGAPRAPELEFEASWPLHVREFVAEMAAAAPPVFVKFTRASHKLEELARIAPEAHFVHLVRDPRAVATSHLFRRAPEFRQAVLRDGNFFTLTTGYDQWKAETMARHLVTARPEYAGLAGEPGYVQVMLVWKELFERTQADARRCFPGRHVLVSHERLCADPLGTLERLHASWGLESTRSVRRWAQANVRPAGVFHAPADPAWDRALDLHDLRAALAEIYREAL